MTMSSLEKCKLSSQIVREIARYVVDCSSEVAISHIKCLLKDEGYLKEETITKLVLTPKGEGK